MSKYKLIIFDCDGTLVDTEETLNDACSQVLLEMGHAKYTPDYCLKNFIGISLPDVLSILQKDIGDSFNPEEFLLQTKISAKKLIEEEVKSMPNAAQMLEKLKDFPRCVASNGSRDCVVKSLEVTNLLKYFDHQHIFTYELVTNPKPAPDLFLYAARQMGFSPSECLVIEDSIVGTTAAKSAKIDVLAYEHPNRRLKHDLSKLNPTAVIMNLEEIIDYI